MSTGSTIDAGALVANDSAIEHALCTFWIAGRLFGLDVGLVGEVVNVDAVLPVPASPPAVRGLVNLRGAPIVLLDTADVLGLDGGDGARPYALVLAYADVVAALAVDRIDAVIAPGRLPTVDVTVLDAPLLVERIESLRIVRDAD